MEFAPERALVITPHPDDAEMWAGGTIAKWVKAGADVHYVLCTDGGKGTDDPEVTSEELVEIRSREQMAAAEILGVSNVVMLGRPDGELEDAADFRKELVRQIRLVKPDVVLTTEPYRRNMQWHRDHRIAGGRLPWTPSFHTPATIYTLATCSSTKASNLTKPRPSGFGGLKTPMFLLMWRMLSMPSWQR